MKTVRVGKDLKLDAQALATSVTALLGIRGSGKSTTAGVIAEGLMDAGIPVVIIDQVGPWFGLRLQPDGKTPSRFKIPVLGGAHGDITLSPQAGRQVAEALATSRSSAILDISMMRKGERIRFCADFAEAFLDAKKRAPGAVSLILEEAQDVIPQIMQYASPDMARCLGSFDDIASVGRNFGIGLILLSLRPQKLNKGVLNLSETVFGFRMLGPQERKTIADWVQEKGAGDRAEVAGELPSLKRGTAIVWSPSVFGVYGVHALAPKTTYDASSTPGADRAAVTTKPLDLAALESTMAQVVAEAKANDPKALRARIAELERAKPAAVAASEKPPKVIERRVLSEADIKRMESACQRLMGAADKVDATHKAVADDIGRLIAKFAEAVGSQGAARLEQGAAASVAKFERNGLLPANSTEKFRGMVTFQRDRPHPPADATGSDKGGQNRMLRALAETLKDGLSRRELGALSGVKASGGTFGTYLSRLRQAGHIEDGGAGIRITDAGREVAGPVTQRTGADLLDFWVPQLGDKPAAMLRRLFDAPGPVGRDVLADDVGLSGNAGTFGTYLSRLVSRGLVDKVGRGEFTVSEAFRS